MKNSTRAKTFRWTKTSTGILGGFLILLFLIGYVWWPLLEEYVSYFNPEIPIWQQLDWLLIGNFLVMSILITLNADIKEDFPYMLIALCGGFIIEAWGTQSGLWTYYTFEKPPLWIIPAWPIAALSVKRLHKISLLLMKRDHITRFKWIYWLFFAGFYILLIDFSLPSIAHPLSIFALVMCAFVIIIGKNYQDKLMIFVLGSGLGFFLERWGTTRLCWAYYTGGMPPFFTVLAHGMASMAIYQVYFLIYNAYRDFIISYKVKGYAKDQE